MDKRLGGLGNRGGVLTEAQTMALRERLYGAVSALSLLIVFRESGQASAWLIAANLLITALGLAGAALIAELLAHTAARSNLPDRTAFRDSLRAAFQIVQAAIPPLAVLSVAGLGWIDARTALVTSIVILEVELGAFAFLAVWRTPLQWPRKLVAIASVLLLGAAVIALKTLVH